MSKAEERIIKFRAEADKALQRAKEKRAELSAMERRLKNREGVEERKRDTRRKILVGSMHLELSSRCSDRRDKLQKDLDKYLTRSDDRALFDLECTEQVLEKTGLQQPSEALTGTL